jgi:hypothetical protein
MSTGKLLRYLLGNLMEMHYLQSLLSTVQKERIFIYRRHHMIIICLQGTKRYRFYFTFKTHLL